MNSIDTFCRYYDYRNRSGREASWPVHLYFILFIGDQFVARTGDQYCSQEYNSSIRSADSTIDQEMQTEKAEAIRNAGQEVKDLFHQAMMQRQAEDERKAEQIRLTLETMRENRRLN